MKKKNKSSQTDVITILIATFLAITINIPNFIPDLTIKNIISVLFLFLPGYSFLIAIYPINNFSIIKKILYSFPISIGFLILIMFLEKTIFNASIIMGSNLTILLSIITMIFVIIAYIRRKNEFKNAEAKNRIVCEKCGGYYKLQEGESLEDFESCQCGGKLFYDYRLKSIEKERLKTSKKEDKNRKYSSYDLLFVMAFTIFCLAFLMIPSLNGIPLGKALGTLLIIFLPGYTLTATIYPRKQKISWTERIGLSLMLSLLITLILGLILNYKGFNDYLILIPMLLAVLTMLGTVLAYAHRLKIPSNERFDLELKESWSNLKGSLWNKGNLSGKLSILLIFLLLASIATTIYLIAYPNPGESFTEFYLLGPKGKAADYPTNLTSGKTGKVIIGIVNHEHQNTPYKMIITSNGKKLNERNITLNDEEKIEIPYNFTAGGKGKKKLEFLLYKIPDEKDVYLSLHLWVNVK